MNTMRSTFYGALRATPVYPRREAGLFLLVAVVAITYGIWGWPAVVVAFALTALRALRSTDGIGEAIIPLLVVAGIAAGSVWVLVQHSAWLLFFLAVLASLALLAWWLLTEVAAPFTTKGVVERRSDREQRAGGVASQWDIAERASRAVMLDKAHVMRPSLAGVPKRTIDSWEVASCVATLDGWRGLRRVTRSWREVWVICRDATLRVGGPGTGKTVSLARLGARAPGALLTTSTRPDLAAWLQTAREVRREYAPRGFWARLLRRPARIAAENPRAVHFFNPTGIGNITSTVRWSILVGCQDYMTAVRRSADLIPEGDSTEGERWDADARLYLPVLLQAAAIARVGVERVQQWLSDIAKDETAERAHREIVNILARDPAAGQRLSLLRDFVSLTSKTRSGVLKSMTPALAWMADDTARLIGAAPLDEVTLDVRRFLLEGETLHILGPDTAGGNLQPLTSALVGEVAHEARMLASTMPGGRLDPQLTAVLDEIAVATRLPLPNWSADMGGLGVAFHLGVQSLAQLTECWGKAGAATLLGNVGTLLLFGGGKDAEEMEQISKLAGEFRMRVVGADHDGVDSRKDGERRGEFRWQHVLTPAVLSNLPPFHAAIIQRNLGGIVIARTPTTLDDGMVQVSLIPVEAEVAEPEFVEESHLALAPALQPEVA